MGDDGAANRQSVADVMNNGLTHRTGWIVYDEPPNDQNLLNGIRDMTNYLKSVDPDKLIYINMKPELNVAAAYEPYLQNVMATVRPDVLMYDHYPFFENQGPGGIGSTFYTAPSSYQDQNHGFLNNMMMVRAKAKQWNVPYFGHVQSMDTGPWYLPTATELRAQLFSQLTAGYKGIYYWSYEVANRPDASEALVNVNSSFNPATDVPMVSSLYSPAAAANAEIARLGPTLVKLDSTDVRYLPSTAIPTVIGLTNWAAGAGSDPHITSVASRNNGANGLIGFFRDLANQPYFMLTNLNHAYGATEAAMAGQFNVTFDSSIDRIYRLNRNTGQVDAINLTGHTLANYNLLGGHGDLFNYTGDFVGVDETARYSQNFESLNDGQAVSSLVGWTNAAGTPVVKNTAEIGKAIDPRGQSSLTGVSLNLDAVSAAPSAGDGVWTFGFDAYTIDTTNYSFEINVFKSPGDRWAVVHNGTSNPNNEWFVHLYNPNNGRYVDSFVNDGGAAGNHTVVIEFVVDVNTDQAFFRFNGNESAKVQLPAGAALTSYKLMNLYFDAPPGGSMLLDNVRITNSQATAVPGDFDGDGDVDGADFVAWQTHFPTASGATLATGDADGDGDVDGADFVVWQTHFPTSPASVASTIPTPEPSSIVMASALALLPLLRRRSKMPCTKMFHPTESPCCG